MLSNDKLVVCLFIFGKILTVIIFIILDLLIGGDNEC